MSDVVLGALVGAFAGLIAAFATIVPGVRRALRHRRQVDDVILGVPRAQGVEERPSLVDRVGSIEASVKDVSHQVTDLTTSHTALSATLRDHMQAEESTMIEMRAATAKHRAEMQSAIDSVHAALIDHAAALTAHAKDDLKVSEEIRSIATQATVHAVAAHVAADESAAVGQRLLESTAAISTALGAETPPPE